MRKKLTNFLSERIILFDGAMGTMLQEAIDRNSQPLEVVNLNQPGIVRDIHCSFLEAGADIITTNTFSANKISLAEYGLESKVEIINKQAVTQAEKACNLFSAAKRPLFIAGSLGPGNKLPTLGQIELKQIKEAYYQQGRALLEAGVDILLLETCQDILQVKGALLGIKEALRDLNSDAPIIVSLNVAREDKMLLGTSIRAAATVIEPFKPLAFGLNCSDGPHSLEKALGEAHGCSPFFLLFQPNAGRPVLEGGRQVYPQSPEEYAGEMKEIIARYPLNFVGGCCGSRPEHIGLLHDVIKSYPPHKPRGFSRAALSSLYREQTVKRDKHPLIIGEGLNSNVSQNFRRALAEGDMGKIIDLGRKQVLQGAQCLDINTAYSGAQEKKDLSSIIKIFNSVLDAPLVLDSQDPTTLAAALELVCGKPLINFTSLENKTRAREVMMLARDYGTALVCRTIGPQGMALSREAKIALARELYHLACVESGLLPENLFFDPLTFSLATGKEEYKKTGLETLMAIKEIKNACPGSFSLLAISNISYGLEETSRILLNSIYFHLAIQSGMDAAIINPGEILKKEEIPPEAWAAGEKLILHPTAHGSNPLGYFIQNQEVLQRPGKIRES